MMQSKTICVVASVAGTLALAAGHAQAAILAAYDFTAADALSGDNDPNSIAGAFNTDANGVVVGDGLRSGTSASWIQTYSTIGSTTAAQAVSNKDFFQFTVKPLAGYKLNLDELSFLTQVKYNTAGVSGTIGGTFFVRSSVTGTTDLASYTQSSATDEQGSLPLRTIELGSQFQGLTAPVDFRIYMYKGSTGYSTNIDAMRVDNVVLTGESVVVPEPAGIAAASALALAGLAGRRKRR